jgi:PleD family two-component response regulator
MLFGINNIRKFSEEFEDQISKRHQITCKLFVFFARADELKNMNPHISA